METTVRQQQIERRTSMVLRLLCPFADGAFYCLLLPCPYKLLHDDVTLRLNPQQIFEFIQLPLSGNAISTSFPGFSNTLP